MYVEDIEKIYDSISISSFEVNRFCKKILIALSEAEFEIKGLDRSRLAIL